MAHSRYVAEPSPLFLLFGAFGADALGHVIYTLHLIAVRVGDCGYGSILQTERAVAHLAVEMYVAVIIGLTGGVAELVAHTLAAVINLVQQMVLIEKGQGAEYAGLIDRIYLILKFGHSDGAVTVSQRL